MSTRSQKSRPNERNPIQDEPPHSVEAEQGVISSIMHAPDVAIAECVQAGMESNWFFVPANQKIYQQLRDAWDSGEAIDRCARLSLLERVR